MEDIDFLFDSIHSVFHSEWRLESHCFDLPTNSWFFDEAIEKGKSICDSCPVRIECRDDAMFFSDEWVRGGMTEEERISLDMHRKSYKA